MRCSHKRSEWLFIFLRSSTRPTVFREPGKGLCAAEHKGGRMMQTTKGVTRPAFSAYCPTLSAPDCASSFYANSPQNLFLAALVLIHSSDLSRLSTRKPSRRQSIKVVTCPVASSSTKVFELYRFAVGVFESMDASIVFSSNYCISRIPSSTCYTFAMCSRAKSCFCRVARVSVPFIFAYL